MIQKSVTAGLSLCVAASGLLLAEPATASAPSALAGANTSPTHFALQASGYSTRVKGGNLPVSSDRTAFQVIGCTNKAGLSKMNSQAELDLTPLLDVRAATTHVWTTSKNGTVSSRAQNKIAQVRLGSNSRLAPRISGITSTSRAYHNGSGFHASTRVSVLSVDPDGSGPLPSLGRPTRGNPITIPGVATVALGRSTKSHNGSGASAQADALRIRLIPSSTTVYLAHSRATIHSGIKSGVFRGSSYAAKAQALDNTVTVGKTPYLVMPCQGTNGVLKRRHIASAHAFGLLALRGLSATQKADQTRRSAYGHETGRVARVRLGNQTGNKTLVVRGVVGKANVYYSSGKGITRDTKGSGILSIRLNGNPVKLNAKGNLRIPGLVTLQSHIVKKTKRTIQITELRLTLLGGNNAGATVNLGYAKVGFTKSF